MSTTEVILEHLISGMQAAIWLFLLVMLAFGYAWLDWNVVKEIPSEWVIALLAIIYPVGMFVDEVADKLFYAWGESIRDRIKKSTNLSAEDQQKVRVGFLLQQAKDDDFLKAHFSYIRTRIRIARAAALNFLLITLTLAALLIFRFSPNAEILSLVMGFGGFLMGLAIFAWYRFTRSFTQRIIDVLRDMREIPS